MVPLQVIWKRTAQRRAAGTSLAAIVPIGAVGACVYYFGPRAPSLDIEVAGFLMLGSAVGALAGARMSQALREQALKLLVVALLVLGAIKELHDAVVGGPPSVGVAHQSGLGLALVTLCGLAIGILSGLTGVGGGVLLVPAFGIGQKVAQGTSLLAILPTEAVGAFVHQRHGDVDMAAAGRMSLAGVPSRAGRRVACPVAASARPGCALRPAVGGRGHPDVAPRSRG